MSADLNENKYIAYIDRYIASAYVTLLVLAVCLAFTMILFLIGVIIYWVVAMGKYMCL